MEENIKKIDRVDKNKKLKKWFKIIVLIALLIFVLGLVFNKYFWLSTVTSFQNKMMMRNIAKYEQKFKDDKYGGKTPEETYVMFLEALKKKDIELASKYFVLEKQEEYKKALYEVDKNGKWDLMMEDLTNYNNMTKEKTGDNYYTINIFRKDDPKMLSEQIIIILPTKILNNTEEISDIWKISTF